MSLSIFLTAYFWLFLGCVLGFLVVPVVVEVRREMGYRKTGYRDFTLTKEWLASLLSRGYDGAYLRLGHEQSDQLILFRKYVRGKGDYGLEFQCFGAMDWPEDTWRNAQAVVEEAGMPNRLEALDIENGSRNVLVSDCGHDTAVAYEIGKSIWIGTFGLPLNTPQACRGAFLRCPLP